VTEDFGNVLQCLERRKRLEEDLPAPQAHRRPSRHSQVFGRKAELGNVMGFCSPGLPTAVLS